VGTTAPESRAWEELARSRRWRALTGFVARWYEPLGAQDGLPRDVVRRAGRRLGLTVPSVVEELCALLGRRADLLGGVTNDEWTEEDRTLDLLHPRDWRRTDGVLAMFAESGGYPLHGLRDLTGSDDPPVWAVEETSRRLHPESTSFTELARHALVHRTGLMGRRFEALADGPAVAAFVAAGFEAPYPVLRAWTQFPQRVLAAPGVVAVVTEGAPDGCYAAVRTREGRERLEAVGVEWLESADAPWRAHPRDGAGDRYEIFDQSTPSIGGGFMLHAVARSLIRDSSSGSSDWSASASFLSSTSSRSCSAAWVILPASEATSRSSRSRSPSDTRRSLAAR
jgi:hypothetical protein